MTKKTQQTIVAEFVLNDETGNIAFAHRLYRGDSFVFSTRHLGQNQPVWLVEELDFGLVSPVGSKIRPFHKWKAGDPGSIAHNGQEVFMVEVTPDSIVITCKEDPVADVRYYVSGKVKVGRSHFPFDPELINSPGG